MMFEKLHNNDTQKRIEQAHHWRHLRARLRHLPPESRDLILSRWHSAHLKSTRHPRILNWLISNTLALTPYQKSTKPDYKARFTLCY